MQVIREKYISNLESVLGYLLTLSIFGPILIFQAILKPVKIPFIAIGLGLAILHIAIKQRIVIHKYILILCFFYLLKGIYGTASGVLQDAPGVFIVLPLSITYVILHYFFIVLFTKEEQFKWIIHILFFCTAFVIFLNSYFIMNFLGLVPDLAIYNLFQNSPTPFKIGVNRDQSLELYTRNLGLFPFVFPFFISLIYAKKEQYNFGLINRYSIIFLCITSILMMLMTGRRIFILILLITPILLFIFSRFMNKEFRSKINRGLITMGLIGSVLILSIFSTSSNTFNLSLNNVSESFIAAFDSSKENIRAEQGKALINSWKKAPIFGHGIGSAVDGYIRDPKRPWAFEMGFHTSLHRLGLLGFSFELLYYIGIIILGIRYIKKHNDFVIVGLLSGFMGFLIAHATNPFLNSYEFLWPVILPLIYLNIKLNKSESS